MTDKRQLSIHMVLEYLINDDNEREKISGFKPEGINSTMGSVKDESFWYARYSLEGKDERTARKMSEVDLYVREHFNVVVLQNDCSEYFNNRLYPLMSKFERKLRRMLYVFSGIKKDDEYVKDINKLEEKTLGEIFSLLFIDDEFMSRVKDKVKKQNRDKFSKNEILKLIEEERENVFWDNLFGKDIVPTLRANFQKIRNSRNDIMHSHNIGYKEYRTCRRLLEKINKEIDEALDNVSIKEQISKRPMSFGQTLAQAINYQESLSMLRSAAYEALLAASVVNSPEYKNMQEFLKNINSSEYRPQIEEMNEALKLISSEFCTPVITQMTSIYKENSAIRQILEQAQMNPSFAAPLKELSKTMREIADQGSYEGTGKSHENGDHQRTVSGENNRTDDNKL